MAIDRNASKKAGKNIYYTNDATDGYQFRFRWERPRNGRGCPESKYNLIMSKSARRRLRDKIVSGKTDYIYSKNKIDDPEFRKRIHDYIESLRRSGSTGDQS
jgi:hypothetical protein